MIPNGRHSLLLFLPFLLYFVAPSHGIECLLRMEFAPRDRGFTREIALRELREKYSTVEEFKFDVGKLFKMTFKLLILKHGGKAYKIKCSKECCAMPTDHSESPILWSCGRHCTNSEENECNSDMCNRGDFKGNPETLKNGTDSIASWTATAQNEVMRLISEISPEVKKYILDDMEKLKKKQNRTEKEEKTLQMYLSVFEEQSKTGEVKTTGGVVEQTNTGGYNALPQSQVSSSSRRIVYQIFTCAWIVAVFV